MNHYKRDIGEYSKKAGRLSMLQHGAYTLLIDSCYDRERFPTYDEAIEWAWASTDKEIEAVEFVLHKFFVLENNLIYVQKSIQKELVGSDLKSETSKKKSKKPISTPIPEDFSISERVRKWAMEKKHSDLNDHLEYFVGYARANGKKYVDWDEALMNAIRNDWGKIREKKKTESGKTGAQLVKERFANANK